MSFESTIHRSNKPLTSFSFALFLTCGHSSRWLLQSRSKARPRKEDIDLLGSIRSVHAVRHYYLHFLSQLAQRCRLRQRVVATAQVFFRRFYTQSTVAQHDPALIAATALLIAAKVEECAVNAKALVKQLQPAATVSTTRGSGPVGVVVGGTAVMALEWPYSVADVIDCEFVVLHALLFDLIVFHPYRPLVHFVSFFQSHERYADLVQRSWELVNESYYSDVVLLFAPYVVATSCLYMAAHMMDVEYRGWLKSMSTPQQVILDCTHELLHHINRREAMQHETTTTTNNSNNSTSSSRLDALGCTVNGRLLDALERLQRRHAAVGKAVVSAGVDGVGGRFTGSGGGGEEEKGGSDKDEKAAGDEVGLDGMDAAMVDAVVILQDSVEDGSVTEVDLSTTARKKQKIGDG